MSPLRLLRRAAPLAALFGTTACASVLGRHPASRESLLSDAPAPRERACHVADLPVALPEAGALINAPVFSAAAAYLWREAGRPPGHILFSLRYDPKGVNVHRGVIEHSIPAALADTLQKLVFVLRHELPASGSEWGVRLRVDLADEPLLRVGRREVCNAAPRDRQLRSSATSWVDVRNEYIPDFALVMVRVRLDAYGQVTDARVERSQVRGNWEHRLLAYVRTLDFDPAMEDGVPVPSETQLRLRVPRN
ncbi:MAG TPA: energy transducer TonB [Longimicrobiaceae bacterium]|nr:energy transducer TonB [Longimicrobiaceae bacterium]